MVKGPANAEWQMQSSLSPRERVRVRVSLVGLMLVCAVVAGCADEKASDVNGATLSVPPGIIRVAEASTGYVNILPDEVKEKLDAGEDFALVDVRLQVQYQAGHLPTAISMPLARLPWAMNSLARDKEVVAYCQIGVTSVTACNILTAGGFSEVKNMVGGISAWPYDVVSGNTVTVSL